MEFGCNIGLNLRALKLLLPSAEISGVEINKAAVDEARKNLGIKQIFHESIINFSPEMKYDLVLTKGVLIHIPPDELLPIYRKMAAASAKYVLICEYYNPTPVTIDYRGHKDRLFKRDFASEFLDANADFRLIDYRFHYKKTENFSQDDITWFLMERAS